MEVREADLDKHLSNNQDPEAGNNKPVEDQGKSEKPKDDNAGNSKSHGKPKLEPGEIVSKSDYQFNQALTLLKGLSLLQSRKN
jgi:carboxyl-terminal processing protease